MEKPDHHLCTNCRAEFSGKYCNRCGQKRIDLNDKSIVGFLKEAAAVVFQVDNKVFRTFKTLLLHPGQYSSDYASGLRKPYLKPLSIFIGLCLIYFLVPIFHVFNNSFDEQLKYNWTKNAAKIEVKKIIQDNELTYAEVEEKYNSLSPNVAKWMLFTLIVIFFIPISLLHFNKREFAVDHLILSTEINCISLLYNVLITPLALILILMTVKLFGGDKGLVFNDDIIIPVVIAIFSTYVYFSFRNFYKEKWYFTITKSFVFIILANIGIQQVYRSMLFWITIKLI